MILELLREEISVALGFVGRTDVNALDPSVLHDLQSARLLAM